MHSQPVEQEFPYQEELQGRLASLRQQIDQAAEANHNLEERFSLDTLTALLDRILHHIPQYYPQLSTHEKERVSQLLRVNCELIKIGSEYPTNVLTRLKSDAPELTLQAVRHFYKAQRKRPKQWPNLQFIYGNKLFLYKEDDGGAPTLTEVPGENPNLYSAERRAMYQALSQYPTVATIQAYLARSQRFQTESRSQAASQAIFLYKQTLLHYNRANLAAPTLTPIRSDFPDTDVGKTQRLRYAHLQKKIQHLPSDTIGFADREARACLAELGLLVPSGNAHQIEQRPLTLSILVAIIKELSQDFEKRKKDWAETKKFMLSQSVLGSLLVVGILFLQLAAMLANRYLLGAIISAAKITICMKVIVGCGLALTMLALGLTAYAYIQERFYQQMLTDMTHVNFVKTYPAVAGRAESRREINMSSMTFFQQHQEILDTAFPPELRMR